MIQALSGGPLMNQLPAGFRVEAADERCVSVSCPQGHSGGMACPCAPARVLGDPGKPSWRVCSSLTGGVPEMFVFSLPLSPSCSAL